MLLNLSILASSSGASTSSKIQKGAGFKRYIENNNAVAVNVFLPPLNWLIPNGRFPFGFRDDLYFRFQGLGRIRQFKIAVVTFIEQRTKHPW